MSSFIISPEHEALYALSHVDGIGSKRLLTLCEHFGSAERSLAAAKPELASIDGFGPALAEAFVASRDDAKLRASNELKKLPPGTQLVSYYDEAYPSALRTIYSPPAMFFVQGNTELLHAERNVAVIGTRKMTDYGMRVTKEICKEFASAGVVVTSGFALGVDTAAHHAVFEAGGATIGVLGSGIDVMYPKQNMGFAEKLIASGRGAIITELPLGAMPDPKNFPWRNRIVSGLSRGVIVIESLEHGGSMITASIALDQNRDIFALPGDIGRPTSEGPNKLISESRAKLFRSAADILTDLGWKQSLRSEQLRAEEMKQKRVGLTLFEQKIVEVLDEASVPLHIDVIAERSGTEVSALLALLLELELRDVVRQLAGKNFSTIF